MTTQPQKAWWEERVRALFHGVWGASPWNEERMTDTSIEILKDVFRKQQTRDWEEFREMVQNYPAAWHEEGWVVDKLTEQIDSKLSSLKSDK